MDANTEARYRHPDTWFASGSTRLTPGEIYDRLSILALKIGYSAGTPRQAHFIEEEQLLLAQMPGMMPAAAAVNQRELSIVNAQIWERTGTVRLQLVPLPPDGLTDKEALRLGRHYIEIFTLNERRAALIQTINAAMAVEGEGEKL